MEVALELEGTDFQRAVWQALVETGCGERITYAELAERAGRPRAVRAAGHANGANPLSIVVPCHRVVGANSIGGYGGPEGVEIKRALLALEQA